MWCMFLQSLLIFLCLLLNFLHLNYFLNFLRRRFVNLFYGYNLRWCLSRSLTLVYTEFNKANNKLVWMLIISALREKVCIHWKYEPCFRTLHRLNLQFTFLLVFCIYMFLNWLFRWKKAYVVFHWHCHVL